LVEDIVQSELGKKKVIVVTSSYCSVISWRQDLKLCNPWCCSTDCSQEPCTFKIS